MRIGSYFVIVATVFAASAQALSVSNLDDEPYFVVFEETMGSKVVRRVDPGETIQTHAVGGTAYLRSKPEQRLQIQAVDRLAIWPEGNLQIQMRQKDRAGGDN